MEAPPLLDPPQGASPWLVASGIILMILWLAGAFVLGTMKLMANDSGSASADAHLGMIAAGMGASSSAG